MLVNSSNTANATMTGAIQQASQATAASFNYLLATAQVESLECSGIFVIVGGGCVALQLSSISADRPSDIDGFNFRGSGGAE